MSLRLVDDWKESWKWFSTHMLVVQAALQISWRELEPEQKASLPSWTLMALTLLVIVLGWVGRIIEQRRRPPATSESES